MTPEQIIALGPALTEYLGTYRECFKRQPVFDNFVSYAHGLLSDEKRKSVEPMALAAGAAVRTLQLFLSGMVWDQKHMRDLLQKRVAAEGQARPPEWPDAGRRIGLIDETSVPKKGDQTPGVKRQYCGNRGKTDNCIVTVHLGYVHGDFKAVLDSDLFLPQDWSKDRKRCRAAKIPDELVHRTKPRIAIEQVKRALGNGIRFDFLTYDEGYGRDPQFLFDLEELGQIGVGEVPRNFRCLALLPRRLPADAKLTGKTVYNVSRWSASFIYQSWTPFSVARETLTPQVWDVKAAQVHLLKDGRPLGRKFWLVVAWNRQSDQYKYFVSNAPADTPLATLVAVAFKRAQVEHLFRVLKGEVGFGHYEGRSYPGLMRHMVLCQVLLLFLALRATSLRGEKPAGHDGADRSRSQRPLPPVARPGRRSGYGPADLVHPSLPTAA
jgi:SRSO17 transposase